MPKHSKHRRGPSRRRVAVLGLAFAATASGAAAWAAPSQPTEPVIVDSLTVTPTATGADSPVTASVRLHATKQTSVQALTVAVRSADGRNYDFRGAIPATLGSTPRTFTPETRTFPAGTYTYFVAYESNNRWHNLKPIGTFTAGSSTPAPAPSPSATASPTPTASSSASPTATPTPTPTPTATPTPTGSPTSSPFATPTPTASPTGTASPTASPSPSTGSAAAPLGIPGSWRQVFADEFNDSTLDATKWNPNWFGCATCITPPVNGAESAAYAPSQVSESGGSLHLTAAQKPATVNGKTYQYTSGLVNTNGKAQFTYGAFESRIYLPAAGPDVANWPAFWTDGQNWPADGELDVMEGLSGQACYHFHSPSGGPGGCASGNYTGWHTFGAEWAPGSVTYYYDGVKVGQITSGITSSPMYVILNNAVYASGPTATPADMQVDYVRVWQH
ncbi:family 16 glycosylhydrolase [Kitasatospora sp. NPDC048365]|uniref:glycoside hydrolase family 16 protein n=1 Tax=Kitasatospora sp. NPDC048365 TaxID=3364050 RepID=UPI0037130457